MLRLRMDPKASAITSEQIQKRASAPIEAWELVGNTPLLKLRHLTSDLSGIEIYAKAEWFNPGGSVKDRPALNMIREGERSGRLAAGKTILGATSGNTRVGTGRIGGGSGDPLCLGMAENASVERKKILRAYGAEIIYTSPFEGSDGAQREAR